MPCSSAAKTRNPLKIEEEEEEINHRAKISWSALLHRAIIIRERAVNLGKDSPEGPLPFVPGSGGS